MPNPLIQPVYIYRAEITRVVDGDTLRANIDCGLRIWAHDQRIRMAGISAPELATLAGGNARDALVGIINELTVTLGKRVLIQTFKCREDQYGRWLAIVQAGDVNLNDWMIEHGHAVARPIKELDE